MLVGGASVATATGNDFFLIVDCCDTRSCMYTQLIAHDSATDNLPADYSIGVDNVVGSTTFDLITNTCAKGCGTNDYICGTPTYTLLMQDGSTVPTFIDTLVVSATEITHSAQTADLNLEGSYTLEVLVFLDKSSFANAQMTPTNQQLYIDAWTVTVDVCNPLPCNYNKILTPDSGALLPSDLAYLTDGEPVSTQFEYY